MWKKEKNFHRLFLEKIIYLFVNNFLAKLVPDIFNMVDFFQIFTTLRSSEIFIALNFCLRM